MRVNNNYNKISGGQLNVIGKRLSKTTAKDFVMLHVSLLLYVSVCVSAVCVGVKACQFVWRVGQQHVQKVSFSLKAYVVCPSHALSRF